LAFVGAPISDEELVIQAVQGLGTDYNPIVVAVNAAAHHSPFSFSDLHGLLVSHESLLKSQVPVTVPSAFHTTTDNSQFSQAYYTNKPYKPKPNYYNNNSPPLLPNPSTATTRPPSRPPIAPLSQLGNSPYGNKISCQICFKPGHTAKLCYRRYNFDPEWQPNPRFQAYNAQVISHAHAQTVGQSAAQNLPPHPSTADVPNANWLLDSGANSHVTTDLNNLSSFYEYTGPDQLLTGSGNGLPISHIGSCALTVHGLSIRLTNVLYVPQFSTNLISISQLLQDNPTISLTFSSSSCFIKDQMPPAATLQVSNSHGLFMLPLHSTPQAFHGVRASPSIWHARFCHPSTTITNELVNLYQLPCNKEPQASCVYCLQAKSHRLPFYPSTSNSTFPLQFLHSDVWGPCATVSNNDYKYYVTFIDDFSRYTWIYFMK
jgi:hypothetical protein